MHGDPFIIVGAGLAGAKAAEELRAQGYDGRLLLIGTEPEHPYERPPLSKDYLRGESPREKIYVHDEGFYAEHAIELLTGVSAASLDAVGSRLRLAGGDEIAYDRLLLATGSEPRRLEVPGSDLDGVCYLRTVADGDVLRERLVPSGPVVVVGGGWIGTEIAASARQLGHDVTLIAPDGQPLEHAIGPELGRFYRDVHLAHGVELLLENTVQAFDGAGSLEAVRTSDGRLVDCSLAVIGIGAEPRVALASAAGLAVDDGVLVDAALASSSPAVFAAGDVANAWHPFYGRRIRVEHWANALNQGPAAARAMLGLDTVYDRLPYFYSDQYDVGMEYRGHADGADAVVLRGDPESGQLLAFWLAAGAVIAAMNVNVWDVGDALERLIRSRRPVPVELLADPDTPLDALAAEA